ncbi:DUF4157 domain-containing protein [Sorangium sp. So ce375]|uniref:eCIS core domain-containing protein n=1 Tax=Sorangium sp. So ce375 TaxID=3133306 RepID=UPI003F5C8B3F
MRPAALPRVIQAFFPERRVPAGTAVQRFARTVLPPHPATAAQPRAAMDLRQRPPHPATVAQPRPGLSFAPRPPHPATVAQPRVPFGAAPRAAGVAQRKEADVHAFQPPAGFLEGPAKAGHRLPPSVQLRMERYFGADFSDVRVHVGPEAASIGALAFTLGSDLYFAPEHYQPHTRYGQELLGHELTHVVQQREGRVANPYGDGVAVVQDFELEAEADRHGKAAAEGKMGPGSSGPAPGGAGGPAGAQAKGSAQAKGGVQAKGGYRLLVGAYMHDQKLPEPLSGHSFVAIEEPSGQRRAFGFSPARYSSYDPQRDLGRLRMGVEGVVHDDRDAFERPGVKTRAYAITPQQARAAMAKVAEYESGRYRYSLEKRQCSTFALDVLRAASVPVPEDGAAPRPRVMYEALDDES